MPQQFEWNDDLVHEYVSRIVTGDLGTQPSPMERFKQSKRKVANPIPAYAVNLECFHIRNGEAYVGYTLPNGNFEYVQLPYAGKQPECHQKSKPTHG